MVRKHFGRERRDEREDRRRFRRSRSREWGGRGGPRSRERARERSRERWSGEEKDERSWKDKWEQFLASEMTELAREDQRSPRDAERRPPEPPATWRELGRMPPAEPPSPPWRHSRRQQSVPRGAEAKPSTREAGPVIRESTIRRAMAERPFRRANGKPLPQPKPLSEAAPKPKPRLRPAVKRARPPSPPSPRSPLSPEAEAARSPPDGLADDEDVWGLLAPASPEPEADVDLECPGAKCEIAPDRKASQSLPFA
ncbi:unnamed protein product [Effrenium voratum]|nr:unnamed protein product [Effrenium voratum]